MSPDLLDIEPRLEVVRSQMSPKVFGRVNDLGDRLTLAVPDDFRDSEFLEKVKALLAAAVNEDTTDAIIDMITPLAPWGLGWIVGKILDRLLPEQLLALAFSLLDRIASV